MPAALYFDYGRRGVGTETRQRERLPRRECSNVHDRGTAARCHMRQNDAHSEPAADDAAGRSRERIGPAASPSRGTIAISGQHFIRQGSERLTNYQSATLLSAAVLCRPAFQSLAPPHDMIEHHAPALHQIVGIIQRATFL
jgi:hypothetical protein